MEQEKLNKRIFKQLHGKLRSPAALQSYLVTETDKGCVASVEPSLSAVLKKLIKARLGEVKSTSFASKIKLAYEKGLIPENIFHDLELIRKIRNQIVHEEGVVDFDDKEIRELCAKFKNVYFVEDGDPRKIFCTVASHIFALLLFAQNPAHKLDSCSAIEFAQEGVKMLAAPKRRG